MLSIPEVNKYFGSDEARRCAPTEYAISQGAYTKRGYMVGGKAACWWWLRSPGYGALYAANVDFAGSVGRYGNGAGRVNSPISSPSL